MNQQDRDALFEAAMRLPAEQRIDLADRLWASLDRDERTRVEQAQAAECERRLQAYRDGRINAIDGQEILSTLRQGRRP